MNSLVLLLLVGACLALHLHKIVEEYEGCTSYPKPWQASLNVGYHFCSGSLISQNWVVSAAHCYKSRLEVRLGKPHIQNNEGTEQVIFASKVIRHPNYSSWTGDSDIMLIKLRQPATLNNYVQPIALPNSCPVVGTWCTVSGWGNYGSSTAYHTKLQCLEVPVLSDWDCKYCYQTNNMFCAGFLEGGRDCWGDTGGSLVCNGELQGIVPWNYKCNEKNCIGVYVKVCVFTSWISQAMANS
ncbi:trypsin-2-like isoform X1 [Tachysurus vachellii]|uniref:trypsin-2-like isoform X1 n=1 Tax=Tachysurus vachellii TaxID=175792 RepID=UPI00296AA4E0|nr:trypsin-2-like isoform X1 [Tachysurus vachellii]